MAVRRLDEENWASALSRLGRWLGDLALSWALVRDGHDDPWQMLGITVRGGTTVPERTYEYAHLKLQSRMQRADLIAESLRAGHFTRPSGEREFREIPLAEGTGNWLASGAIYGMTGTLPTPSYYFTVNLADQQLVAKGRLSEPGYGPNQQPYYPTGDDALWDVLYGMSRHQGRRDLVNQVVIHLPYPDAAIERLEYVEGEGVVVTIGEGGSGWAPGHLLQALWKMHLSETTYQRAAKVLTQAGGITFPMGAEPAYFALSLQNEEGWLVDSIERLWRSEAPAAPDPLPADALPEAFDFLASVWHNLTSHRLFEVHLLSPAAGLTASVASRNDFSSRLTELAEVLKSIKVDDSLIDQKHIGGLAKDSSIGRVKLAVQRRLKSADLDSAVAALDVLQDIVRLRVALQHPHGDPDLPTALARLSISHPPEWSQAWETIRHRTVSALRDLRQALQSALV